MARRSGFILAAVAVGLAVCLGAAAAGPAVAQTVADKLYADLAKLPKEERAKRIVEGAQKEEKLDFIQSIISQIGTDQVKLFSARYPFVKMSMTKLDTAPAAARLVQEETAGRHLTDIITTAVPDMGQIMELDIAARYKTPATDALLPQYKGFIDPEGRWTPWYWSEHGLNYNTALLPKGLTLTSYWDLCKPEFKGQFSMDIAETRFMVGMYTMLGEGKLKEWLQCMGKNEPVIQNGHTVRLELMLAGDHWASPDNYLYRGTMMAEKNPKKAPFKVVYEAPIMAYAAGMVINKNVVHPYGAALLADWALTEECQNFMKAQYRGPVTVSHPYMPDNAQLVTFGFVASDLEKKLHDYWKEYVGVKR